MTGCMTLQEHMRNMPQERQQKINNRAKQLIQAIEMGKLRKAAKLNQSDVGELMGTSQALISKIESGADIRVLTLINYIQAVGGEVSIIAKMPEGDITLI